MFRRISLGTGFFAVFCLASLQAQNPQQGQSGQSGQQGQSGQAGQAGSGQSKTRPGQSGQADKAGSGRMGTSSTLSATDTQFVHEAAMGGMHELKMGQLGARKATNAAVKKYAQRIVSDHTKANRELTALAKRKGIMMDEMSSHSGAMKSGTSSATHPSSADASTAPGTPASSAESKSKHGDASSAHSGPMGEAHATMARLEGMSGSDFDKAFVQAMIEDHQKDIAKFESASTNVTDTDLKNFASKQLPTLRAHLKEAQSLPQQ